MRALLRNKTARQFTIFVFLAAAVATSGCNSSAPPVNAISADASSDGAAADLSPIELLNVSCDPTRELWQDLNEQFASQYLQKTGRKVTIHQSHGGSSAQARAVKDGLPADMVSLAIWPDTDMIRRNGLIAAGWEDRLPEHSLPYYSTIVFVVRKGNPKNIHDWPDLARDDIEIVTPHPKTSGNGKLTFLGAWGSVVARGGTEEQARRLVTKLYQHTPVLDAGARAATMTFTAKNIGDVHITWENEAHLEVEQSKGELEIVNPPVSIRAEPQITWVDEIVNQHGTEAVVKDFLSFLYTPQAQATMAKHFYRPNASETRDQYVYKFPSIKLFEITAIAKDWDEANRRFFDDKAVFDQIER